MFVIVAVCFVSLAKLAPQGLSPGTLALSCAPSSQSVSGCELELLPME